MGSRLTVLSLFEIWRRTETWKLVNKDDRSKNVIINGIECAESKNEQYPWRLDDREVLGKIGETPFLEDCVGVGVKKADALCTDKSSLISCLHLAYILRIITSRSKNFVYNYPDELSARALKHICMACYGTRLSTLSSLFFISAAHLYLYSSIQHRRAIVVSSWERPAPPLDKWLATLQIVHPPLSHRGMMNRHVAGG